MHLYTQYSSWAGGQWTYRGSVFDAYEATPQAPPPGGLARRVVVTMGTMKTYGFRRAVEALGKVLPEVLAPGAEVLWQTGVTNVSGLGIETHATMPAAKLREAMSAADLVIAHAGVGSALTALDEGKTPVLLPRRKAYGEMVDDHQLMIADELATRGLAVSRAPEDLTDVDLHWAMGNRVSAAAAKSSFVLIE
jgi:UDP-N-acetylglucosamine transferase subunit ALG13